MKKKILVSVGCVLLAGLLLLGGCGAAAKNIQFDMASVVTKEVYEDGSAAKGIATSNFIENAPTATAGGAENARERYIIATADISMQTREYEKFVAAMNDALKEMGGYTQNVQEENWDTGRYINATLRVPAEKLDLLLELLEKHGSYSSKNVNYSDITDTMLDTESRKKALETERDALLAVLEKAETVEDIIKVQDRLSQVRGELESYLQQLAYLKGQVSYSTVNLNLSEVDRITTPKQGFGALVGSGFMTSLKNIGSGLRNFAVWLLSSSPYLVIVAAAAAVVIVVLKKVIAKRRRKKS